MADGGEKKKLIGIYLPIETIRNLKVFAANHFRSVSEVAEQAIKEWLKKNKEH